jgi:hypothetical protein
MNRLSLAALGLATALMVSGAALQVAPAHAATAPIVKQNFNLPPPVKKKKHVTHKTTKKTKHATHHIKKKKKMVHTTTKKMKPATT